MSDRRRAILEGAARVIARRGVRGLRVSDLAAEAGVSTALIYYHFKDRTGILRHALAFISDRADRYTGAAGEVGAAPSAADPRRPLERILLLEFQDLPEVRENSTAWGSCGPIRSSTRNCATSSPRPARPGWRRSPACWPPRVRPRRAPPSPPPPSG